MVRIDGLDEPLRLQLSRYSLIDSLYVIYAYVQYLQFRQPLPTDIEVDQRVVGGQRHDKPFHEWELDLLSRQLLQHARMAGKFSLRRWNEFANTVNSLKALEDAISERTGTLLRDNILLELGRLAYRQFPWQERPNARRLVRYYKIFNDPEVDKIIQSEMGLTATEIYLLGLAFTGHFLNHFAFPYPMTLNEIGVSEEKTKLFVRHFSVPLSKLVDLAKASELRDENFAFSQNPLKIFPMVHVGLN